MKLFKNNKKLFLGILIGLILSGITVYATGEILFASSQISFDNTRAGLTMPNGDSVETLEDAIEALASNSGSSTPSCPNSPFNLGDYVDMTPTATSFTPDRTLTGLVDYDTFKGNADGTTTVSGTLHPNYLNVWRVLRINSDCTVEIVSEYVSDQNVKFASKVGYQNYVYYLNEIAKQYANIQFTLDPATAPDGAFRNVGYDDQTKQITNTTRLDDTTLGTASGAWYKKNSSMGPEEELGGGDFKFTTDLALMKNVGIGITAYKKTSTAIPAVSSVSSTAYWLASRLFRWNGSSNWYFSARYVNSSGGINSYDLWYRSSSSWLANSSNNAVRPIVTLDPTLFTVSGEGTSASHRILTAK